ncbi:hypothetical protein NF867_17670 [Solitalea sp. MAHUQ-68]|uniref:DUF3592 domain-containing protein n=1 Tax=Solitalea agri TaxID=2953739 RepID=A0A9X2F5V1_9SPHI|nr:hypothetical protein [Solitalea agri]MCO4294695.1 hypothetical protein [Solitalea agri]
MNAEDTYLKVFTGRGFLIIGIIFILFGLYELTNNSYLVFYGKKTNAVIDSMYVNDSDSGDKKIVIIKFNDSNHEPNTVEYMLPYDGYNLNRSDSLVIYYAKKNPQNYVIDSPFNKVCIGLIEIGIGLSASLLGIWMTKNPDLFELGD